MARVRWNDFSKGWWPLGPGDDIPANALRDAVGVRPFYGGKTIRSRFGNNRILAVTNRIQSITIWGPYIIWMEGPSGSVAGRLRRTSLTNPAATDLITNLGGGAVRFASGVPNPGIDATKFPNGQVGHLFVVGGGLRPEYGVPYDTGQRHPLRKIDTTLAVSPLGLDPPSDSFTIGLQAPIIVPYDLFELVSQWVATGDASTASGSQHQGGGGASLKVTVTSEESGAITRKTSVNLGTYTATFNGVTAVNKSVKQDWIRLWVHCEDPSTVERIDLLFDCGGPASVPADAEQGWENTYSFAIYVGDGVVDEATKPKGVTDTASGSEKRDKKPFYAGGSPRPTTSFDNPDEDPNVAALEVPDAESAKVVEDMATTKLSPSQNTWTHLRIPKMLFNASSEDMDKDHADTWSKVRRCRIIVTANDKGNAVVTFDQLDLHLGIGMQGDYKVALTAHNSKTDTRSMPTAIKEIKGNLRQAITINSPTISGETFDFADEIEIWRTLGNGNVLFFNKAVKYNQIIGPIIDYTADYEGLMENITIGGLGPMKYLKQLILPVDNVRLSKQTYEIAGPYLGRMWSLCFDQRGRVFYSPPGRLEVAAGYVDVTDEKDTPNRLIHWNTMYLYTDTRVFRLITTQEPFLFEEVYGARGSIFPDSIVPFWGGIVSAHHDGVCIFDGTNSRLFAKDAVESFFQNMPSPLVTPLDGANMQTQLLRVTLFGAVHEDEYFLSDGTTTVVVNLITGVWRVTGVGMGPMTPEPTFGHLYAITNPKSATLAAISTVEISTAELDGSTAIPFDIRTSEAKLEDQSGATKIIQRFYADIDTGGQDLQLIAYYLADGSLKVVSATLNTAVRAMVEFADCLPCDVLALRVRAPSGLSAPVQIFELGADVHLPEEGGSVT